MSDDKPIEWCVQIPVKFAIADDACDTVTATFNKSNIEHHVPASAVDPCYRADTDLFIAKTRMVLKVDFPLSPVIGLGVTLFVDKTPYPLGKHGRYIALKPGQALSAHGRAIPHNGAYILRIICVD